MPETPAETPSGVLARPPASAVAAPLNVAQRGAVAADAVDPTSMLIAAASTIRPQLDADLMTEAAARTYADLDGMRVVVGQIDGQWRQWVSGEQAPPLVVHDVRDADDPAAEADRLTAEIAATPLALDGSTPLLVMHLIQLGDESRWIVLGHHAIADGYSSVVIRTRTADWYNHLAGSAPAPSTPMPSVVDAWAVADKGRDDSTLDAWVEALSSLPDRLALAPAPAPLSGRTVRATTLLPAAAMAPLVEAGRVGTWVHPALACIVAYTARVTGQATVVVGFPTAGRFQAAEKGVVTMLARVVPLLVEIGPQATLADVAQETRRASARLKRLGPVTAEELRGLVPAAWRLGRVHGPIVNILPFDSEIDFHGHTVRSRVLNRGPVDDVQLAICPRDGGIEIDGVGNAAAYDDESMARHVERIERLLELAGAHPDIPLLDLDPSLPDEQRAREVALAGRRLLDSNGRDVLLGEVGEIVAADGTRTGRIAIVRIDGTLEDLGEVGDSAVVGGTVVHGSRLRRDLVSDARVADAAVRPQGRKVLATVRPVAGLDDPARTALKDGVTRALRAQLPTGVGARVVLEGDGDA